MSSSSRDHVSRKTFSAPLTFPLWLLLCLFLENAMAAAKTAADYYVDSLPGQPAGSLLKMHAGHIEVNEEHNGNLFFWHFQNKHIANRQRTVLWLNGGPGCSSMDGALMEIGPYRVNDDGTLRYSDGSWDEFANILFVDNPVGTGFSYVDTNSYVHELKEMAEQMVTFLKKFFELFPEYEDTDLYIAGESYAGQHIPYIAQAIQFNNNLPMQSKVWKLSGLLIGNGWISPVEQYDSYLPMAYSAGVIEDGSETAHELEALHQTCTEHLNRPSGTDRVDIPACEEILQQILKKSEKDGQCYNMYDVRLRDEIDACGANWPPDLETVTPYLRRQDVIDALHISKDKKTGWVECAGAVSRTFKPKTSVPSIQILPEILKTVPIVLFSGDQDLICNHIGTEELIHNMEWNGGKGFELSPGTWAPRKHWNFEGDLAGLYQQARNLTYILFYNSSHMVPFDYPRRSRDMLDRFLGVDIASIGGKPTDSRIDGEKGVETSVGGHPNSTAAEQEEAEKLEEAKWAAYYKSGEVALIVVIIMASAWGFYVWRDRRRRAGYDSLFGGSNAHLRKRQGRDVETADFDESELDDLHVASPDPHGEDPEDRYSLGGASSDEDEKTKANGHASQGGERREKPYKDGSSP